MSKRVLVLVVALLLSVAPLSGCAALGVDECDTVGTTCDGDEIVSCSYDDCIVEGSASNDFSGGKKSFCSPHNVKHTVSCGSGNACKSENDQFICGFEETKICDATALPNGGALTGDMNGDGVTDIILEGNDGTVGVAVSGAGGFISQSGVKIATGKYTSALDVLAVGDFDGDGARDVVVGHYADNDDPNGPDVEIDLLAGDGHGGLAAPKALFTPPDEGLSYLVQSTRDGFGPFDFNGDGIDDFVLVTTDDTSLDHFFARVIFGGKNGSIVVGPRSTIATKNVMVADISDDGIPDITVGPDLNAANTYVPNASVYRGASDGTFAAPSSLPFRLTSGAVADLNGDGHTDVVVFFDEWTFGESDEDSERGVTLWNGNGDGTFTEDKSFHQSFGRWPSIGDVSGDGIPDVCMDFWDQDTSFGDVLGCRFGNASGFGALETVDQGPVTDEGSNPGLAALGYGLLSVSGITPFSCF